MFGVDVLGVAPWVIVSAIVSWGATAYQHREKERRDTAREHIEHVDRIEIHRDELTFQLLQNARSEMSAARVEVEDLRDEVRKLRAMENHFYHFQQSLDHLEALLFADTDEARSNAERNARAFLARMRRLNAAKGTIANEAQRVASEISILGRGTGPGEEDQKDG